MTSELDPRVAELEAAARRLRAGDLDGAEAGALVERCAQLAAEIAAELDRRAREAQLDPPSGESPDQESLL